MELTDLGFTGNNPDYYSDYFNLLEQVPQEDLVEAIRELCKDDLFFLSEFVLRNRNSEQIPFIPEFQGEMCRWLERSGTRKMLMAPRGHGKCVDENTEVIMYDGSLKKIKEIEIDDEVIGVDNYKIKKGIVTDKIYSGEKECFELETNNNHSVNITAEHRIYTQDGYKVLKDIKVGDYVVSPRFVNSSETDYVNEYEARFLAYMIFEGGITGGSCNFTNEDELVNADFRLCCDKLGFKYHNNYGKEITTYVVEGSNSPREFLRKFGLMGLNCKNKFLPEEIMKSSKRIKAEFLKVMVDTDGCVCTNHKGYSFITIGLACERLIDEIRLLLLSFGIKSRKVYSKTDYVKGLKRFDQWRLTINGSDLISFYNQIRLIYKQGKLEKAARVLQNKVRNENVDVVPNKLIKDNLKSSGNALKRNGLAVHLYPEKKANNVSRSKLLKIAEFDNNDVLYELAESDFFWEKVTSIKSVGKKRTYDIEVFGTRSFFGNNILMHNSTIANRNYVVWRIINDPNYTCLIASATLDNAKKKLRAIQEVFENNKMFRLLFPELIPASFGDGWTQTQINIPRTSSDPEATVEAQGYEGELTSRHYKQILFDDVVGKENSTNREQIQKVVNFYTQSLQLLKKPGGEMLIIGTMWSYADLHNHVIENLYREFDIYVRSVWAEDRFIRVGGPQKKYSWITTADTKTPLYPGMFPLEDIYKLKAEIIADPLQGMSTWMAQYELKIVDEKTAIFPRLVVNEKNCWFTDEDLKGKRLAFSLSCDPAVSESKEADETVFVVRGLDDRGIWYVIDIFGRRGMREEEIVDRYIQYLIDYPIDLATIETISFQRNLQYAIEKGCAERNVFFPYHKLPSGFLQGSKNNSDLKIRGLAPLYTTGKIKFRRSDEQTLLLLDQLWRFPKSNKDDRADALSQHLWMPIYASKIYIEKEEGAMTIKLDPNVDRYGQKKVNSSKSRLYN